MSRSTRGTAVVALVVVLVLGLVLASALALRAAGPRSLVVPSAWRAAWDTGHVLEGDDVALAWGDEVGADPTSASDGLRFDPEVVVAQLDALHRLDVDVLGLGASSGPLAKRKLLVVVVGTWSTGPGAEDVRPAAEGGASAGDPTRRPTRGDVVDGVAMVHVAPTVLASSADPTSSTADPTPGPSSSGRDAGGAGAATRVPAGTPWELARGVAEALQHLTEAAHPGHGLTDQAAGTLRPAASAYLASIAVPDTHADISDHVLSPHLAWGSARHAAAGWLLLQHLADRSSPTLVRDLWTQSLDTEHVLGAYARLTATDVPTLNRRIAQYAMRVAVGDVTGTGAPGTLLTQLDPVLVAHRTTPVETLPDDPHHHRVTGTFAPAAYGYTVVRLAPDGSGGDVRVRVRGHVEALADADPGWSSGLVAVGPAGPRYGPVTVAADGELRLTLRPGETEVHLVVTATPTTVVESGTGPFARTTRYPYEFRVAGASVVDPALAPDLEGGHRHPDGGGWVEDGAEVDPGAHVAAGAVVRTGAAVGPGVRIEGRAWVESGARLTGDVVVRDVAVVRGSARLSGDVVVGGDAVVAFECDAGAYTSYRAGAVCDPGSVDTDVNPVVTPFAPGETALSDNGPATVPTSEPTPSTTPADGSAATPPAGQAPVRPSAPGQAPGQRPPSPATTPAMPPPPPPPTSPGVAAPPAAVPAGACTARYQVVSSWPGGMQVQVDVTATTSGVDGWTVTWTQPAGLEMADSWGAEITRRGSTVTARNLSWNGTIPDGTSMTFGFNGVTTSDSALTVPQVRCARVG